MMLVLCRDDKLNSDAKLVCVDEIHFIHMHSNVYCGMLCVLFFFKQKTAYEMRISDWSSDVCSSDLQPPRLLQAELLLVLQRTHRRDGLEVLVEGRDAHPRLRRQLGDGDRLLEVALQAADGAIDLLQPALAVGDLPEAHALIGADQAVEDLALHQRARKRHRLNS